MKIKDISFSDTLPWGKFPGNCINTASCCGSLPETVVKPGHSSREGRSGGTPLLPWGPSCGCSMCMCGEDLPSRSPVASKGHQSRAPPVFKGPSCHVSLCHWPRTPSHWPLLKVGGGYRAMRGRRRHSPTPPNPPLLEPSLLHTFPPPNSGTATHGVRTKIRRP